MKEKPIRVAVVGTGGIAESTHIPCYKANSNVELVAVVDNNEKQLKKITKKFKIKNFFSSIDDLIANENVDALSVCTPPNTHAEITLKALQQDINVLCEKPLATDTQNAKKMVAVSIEKGKILMVGFQRRFTHNYQNARKCILSGDLGHVYCIEDHFIEPNPLLNYSKSRWFFDPNVGGVLLDIAPHVLDMLNYMFDDFPLTISACSSTYLEQPVEDFSTFTLEYPNGRVGIGTVSWLSSRFDENMNIYGTAQNLAVTPNYFLKTNSSQFREISALRAAGESLVAIKFPTLPFFKAKQSNAYQMEIDYFINKIKLGAECRKEALNGLSVLLSVDAAKRSIVEKRKVEIEKLPK